MPAASPRGRRARARRRRRMRKRRRAVVGPERPRVVERAHRRGVDVRDQHPHDELRRGVPLRGRAAPTAGTSVTTTPGSESSRSFSRNVARRAAATSDGRRNCSGTTTVTKSRSPRGSCQTSSRIAPIRPSVATSSSSRGCRARVEPARPDRRRRVRRPAHARADVVLADAARVPERALAGGVDGVRDDQHVVRGMPAARTAAGPARSRRANRR